MPSSRWPTTLDSPPPPTGPLGRATSSPGAPRNAPRGWSRRSEIQAVCCDVDGRLRRAARRPAVLLRGSFNPLHAGHGPLAAVAQEVIGKRAAFEMTVLNADKPPLSLEAAEQRRRQFLWR